jgi:hypothetical protein
MFTIAKSICIDNIALRLLQKQLKRKVVACCASSAASHNIAFGESMRLALKIPIFKKRITDKT